MRVEQVFLQCHVNHSYRFAVEKLSGYVPLAMTSHETYFRTEPLNTYRRFQFDFKSVWINNVRLIFNGNLFHCEQ